MSSEKLISLLKSKPFHPFRMKLLDGQTFHVDHKRQIALMPGDSTCIYFDSGGHDSYFTIISLDAVATIEVKKLPPALRAFVERQND